MLLCLPGSAGPGQLARTPAVTSGLGRRLEPSGQDTPAGAGSVTAALCSQPCPGRGAGSAERTPLRLHLKGRGRDSPPRPPQALPGSAAGWAAGWQEGALEVGHVSLGGRLHRRKPELCLCGYNKPVAWWGNLHASQVTAAGPGQQCPQPGAPRPLRGAGCAEPPRVGRAGPGGRTTGSLGQGGPGRGPEAAAPGQPRRQHQGTCPSCAWGRHRAVPFLHWLCLSVWYSAQGLTRPRHLVLVC